MSLLDSNEAERRRALGHVNIGQCAVTEDPSVRAVHSKHRLCQSRRKLLFPLCFLLLVPNPRLWFWVGLLLCFPWTGCADTRGELTSASAHARSVTARPAPHGASCTDANVVSGGTDGPVAPVLPSRPAAFSSAVVTACALLETHSHLQTIRRSVIPKGLEPAW